MSLEYVLTPDHPFGPHDQSKIKNQHTAFALLDLEEPFASLVKRKYTLIYGRKGSGKSAAIALYHGMPLLLDRATAPNDIIKSLNPNTIYVNVRTWNHFFQMNTAVLQRIAIASKSDGAQNIDFDLIPVEVIEELWNERIWDEIIGEFYKKFRDGEINPDAIKNIIASYENEELSYLRGTAEYASSKVVSDAKNEALSFLHENNASVCILFDTMECYPITHNAFGASMAGFLRAINAFEYSYPRISIIFALPEELKSFFEEHSGNILKDFGNIFRLRWSAEQLFRMAAHRFRIFVSTVDKHFCETLKRFDLTRRADVSEFWSEIFPENIQNEIGVREPPVSYLLRHTQMLPRHLIMHLNNIARRSFEKVGNWRSFDELAFIDGVRESEGMIAKELLVHYEIAYRGIEHSLRSSMAGLPPIFPYGKLHKHANRVSGHYDMDVYQFSKLMFRAGMIGRLNGNKTDVYVEADFDFNSSEGMNLASSDTLCFHPIFSRFFSCQNYRRNDRRIVYPTGIGMHL